MMLTDSHYMKRTAAEINFHLQVRGEEWVSYQPTPQGCQLVCPPCTTGPSYKYISRCEISGFCQGVIEVFAVLGCYTVVQVGSCGWCQKVQSSWTSWLLKMGSTCCLKMSIANWICNIPEVWRPLHLDIKTPRDGSITVMNLQNQKQGISWPADNLAVINM